VLQIKEVVGRDDLYLAITEYNGHFVQEKPVPYRQSLANALRNAEHLGIMMKPENRILMANFWQFANEYWGMVQGYTHHGVTPVTEPQTGPRCKLIIQPCMMPPLSKSVLDGSGIGGR